MQKGKLHQEKHAELVNKRQYLENDYLNQLKDAALGKIKLLVDETAFHNEVRCTSVYCSSAHRTS